MNTSDISEGNPMGRLTRLRRGHNITLLEHIKAGDPAIRRWGFMDVTPEPVSTAMRRVRVRLDVWPPGLSTAERSMLRLATLARSIEGWVVGAIIVAAPIVMHRWTVAAILATVLIVGWGIVVVRGKQLRSRVVVLRAAVTADGLSGHPAFEDTLMRLQQLDDGHLSAADYEAEWGRIYRSIGSDQRR